MKNHGTRFLIIFAIAALCTWLTLSKGIKRGLDLAGGSSLTYSVTSGAGDLDKAKLDKAIEVITKRVNATGLTEIFITSTATGQIVVEMPQRSKEEIGAIKTLIERNGQLEFRIREELKIETDQREMRDANPVLYRTPPDRRWVPVNPKDSDFARTKEILVKVPEEPLRRKWEALKASKGETDPETIAAEKAYYEVAAAEVFRGEDLAKTGLEMQGASIVVQFQFKENRKNDFRNFTERNVKKLMAIILDGKVNSAPIINDVLPGQGVISGGGQGFSKAEADELRIVLESGSTGVQLALDREETLGASLGQVAIERGQMSVIVGFIAVVLLMVFYYRLPGMIANVALLMNVVMILGCMAFFRGALSLPGIAGIVLTLGMAVDANILIFERLRDERKRGKSLHESLAAGYDNAMSAIIDGSVTTILTALILIWLGTGAVRGFGVTLTIGLLASMFTAIWVTRVVFEFLIDKGWMKNFDIGPDPKEPTWDYMKARKLLTAPSIALMVIGTVLFLMRDESKSKDLEFIGGQQVIVQLKEAISAERIGEIAKGPAKQWEDANPVALAPEGVGSPPAGSTNRWQIRVKADSEAKGEEYIAYLRKALEKEFVAPAFGDWVNVPAKGDTKAQSTFTVHTLSDVADTAKLKAAIEGQGLTGVSVEKSGAPEAHALRVAIDPADGGEPVVKEKVRKALLALEKPVQLSDPLPSAAFLSPVQAEKLWRTALEATLISLLVQVLYIRLRFADYAHGFAAVLSLIHDVTITLGAVAVFDHFEIVYAKVNLVLIAAILTLIGYSMNDTIVVFDRMRENLGRSKVIRSRLINDSLNQTFARSLRTSMTVFVTVVIQFVFNRGMGSVIEGFAFVMIVGSISGAYSSMFIAAPLLLFLPGYGQKLFGKKGPFLAMAVSTIVGSLMAVTAKGHGAQMWIGVALASVIPVHFLAYFLPWLGHGDPDELVVAESDDDRSDEPLQSPGV